MKEKLSFLKRSFKKKRTWVILGVVLAILGFVIFKPSDNVKNVVSEKVELTDLKQTVLATGQVVSSTDLNLSFNVGGVVNSIKVKVGDHVKSGQVLATLNQAQASANLTSARGALAAAEARLKKIIEGFSNEEITLAKVALENAERDYKNVKTSQETLVQNAYYSLLNSTPEAVPSGGVSDYTAPTISGNYKLGKEGTINIHTYYSGNGTIFSVSGIASGSGAVTTTTPQPIGDSGLYITFPSTTNLYSTNWIIEIPNKKASTYLTNYNIYQSALKTQQSALSSAQSLVDQRQAELAIKMASARSSDIELAEADILSARGQYEQALAKYNDTKIVAPTEGTITNIDIKLGELASALAEVITLQDVSNMYIESNINEANIVDLAKGAPVEITFDAFGPEQIFQGNIISIDPSSTLISGVVNYKIKVNVEKIDELRPGMTANMIIKIREKNRVIAVPSRSILTSKDGSQSIRIITNSKKKKYEEVPVTTGLNGDGGLVEITSGLSVGDEFVVLIKTK